MIDCLKVRPPETNTERLSPSSATSINSTRAPAPAGCAARARGEVHPWRSANRPDPTASSRGVGSAAPGVAKPEEIDTAHADPLFDDLVRSGQHRRRDRQ